MDSNKFGGTVKNGGVERALSPRECVTVVHMEEVPMSTPLVANATKSFFDLLTDAQKDELARVRAAMPRLDEPQDNAKPAAPADQR